MPDPKHGYIAPSTGLVDKIKELEPIGYQPHNRPSRPDMETTRRLDALERKLNLIIVHLGIPTPGEVIVVKSHKGERDE